MLRVFNVIMVIILIYKINAKVQFLDVFKQIQTQVDVYSVAQI
jgi:hypothetical protein